MPGHCTSVHTLWKDIRAQMRTSVLQESMFLSTVLRLAHSTHLRARGDYRVKRHDICTAIYGITGLAKHNLWY